MCARLFFCSDLKCEVFFKDWNSDERNRTKQEKEPGKRNFWNGPFIMLDLFERETKKQIHTQTILLKSEPQTMSRSRRNQA